RAAQTRAAAKIRRTGHGTLGLHCIAAGLTPTEARTVAASLRKNAPKAGVTGQPGTSYRKGAARTCTRYTPREVAAIAVIYRPRKPAFKIAAARLALAAYGARHAPFRAPRRHVHRRTPRAARRLPPADRRPLRPVQRVGDRVPRRLRRPAQRRDRPPQRRLTTHHRTPETGGPPSCVPTPPPS